LISRKKRPYARTQYERDLRTGKTSWLHKPKNMAARDFVLTRENHNPFREGTADHAEYETIFQKLAEEVSTWETEEHNHND